MSRVALLSLMSSLAIAGFTHPAIADSVLYDQYSDQVTASAALVSSQKVSGQTGYDVDVAEDFVVPAGGWTLSALTFRIRHAASVDPAAFRYDVIVSANDGSQPAATAVCSELSLQPMLAPSPGSTEANDKELTAVLSSPCVLPAGTYWLSLVSHVSDPRMGFGWAARPGSFGATARYRNPGNGFLTNCSSWYPVTSCGYPLYQMFTTPVAGGYSAFAFKVIGSAGSDAPIFAGSFDSTP